MATKGFSRPSDFAKLKSLEGTFGWTLQGFLEANPFAKPEQKIPPPAPAPPDGPFRNPTVMFGYLPPTADLKTPSGYYPYSEAGYVTFEKDGTWTGIFRLNLGGNTVPYEESQPTQGRYKLYGDGTGLLTFLDGETPILEIFMVIVDPDQEILLMVTWVNHAVGNHRRGTGSGYMKRMA